jgi:uncharacterized membrane protein YfcA
MSVSTHISKTCSATTQWFLHGLPQSPDGHPVVEAMKCSSGGFYLTVIMLLLVPLAPDHVVRSTGDLFILTALSLTMIQIMRHVQSRQWRQTASLLNPLVCMTMYLACVMIIGTHSPSRMLAIVCATFMVIAGALLVRGLEGFDTNTDH